MASNAKVNKTLISILFLLQFAVCSSGQELQKQEVDSLWWQQKVEQLDYHEEAKKTKKRDINPSRFSMPAWLTSKTFQFILLIVIAAALVFVLFKLFGKDILINDISDDGKAEKLLTEDDLDDYFYDMDLESLLKKALSVGNFAMAIRIRFLMVLKTLIQNQKIQWHKDLTNRQIALQLKQVSNPSQFENLVWHFERVWYGDVEVNPEYYREVEDLFTTYQKSIFK